MEKINLKLNALVIFHQLKDDTVLSRLMNLLSDSNKTQTQQVASYASFVAALFKQNDNLTEYIKNLVLEDVNIYIEKRVHSDNAGILEEVITNELETLEMVSRLSSQQVKKHMEYEGYLPDWATSTIDFVTMYRSRIDNIATTGYGVFSKYHMFSVNKSVIMPVKWIDPITLTDLKGYERERKAVIDNTLALLKGRPAANALLYGDAGTGKSSTIKAIVNEYRNEGLRLVQITKKEFRNIPAIMETLSANPLKFILYIDDLSFAEENDDFNALKAILEGSVSVKTPNVAIYATSNRRHLIKESFSDRSGDDIHRNETIQELCSLSQRFGLTIGFFKPNKKQYLDIVHKLKDQYGIQIDDEQLDLAAERFASSGRSPRAAKQLVEHLKSMEE